MRKIILITILMLLSKGLTAQTTQQNQFTDYLEWLKTNNPPLGNFIGEWLGVRYRLGGSTKKGIDCSQFNKRLYKEVYGLNLKDVCYKQWGQITKVKKDSLQIGDLIYFRSRQSPSGWHCGVYIGNRIFVHAANRYENVKLSSIDEPKYVKSYRGGGRIKR
jgi:lipoprotein Spr